MTFLIVALKRIVTVHQTSTCSTTAAATIGTKVSIDVRICMVLLLLLMIVIQSMLLFWTMIRIRVRGGIHARMVWFILMARAILVMPTK